MSQAIQVIVETYVRLRKEDALLASKQQRLRVLAMCDPGNPMFERLRSQCLEEIAEIEAGLERLRPAPPLPDPPPMPAEAEEARHPASALPDSAPSPQQVEAVSDPAPTVNGSSSLSGEANPPASPTPNDPAPLSVVEPTASAAADAPLPAVAESPPFLGAVSPSLLASTILAGSLSSKLSPTGAKPEAELMRLQIALQQQMRPHR
jgi:hypothetical protein